MKHWQAYCTVHWFVVGDKSTMEDNSEYSNIVYFWWFRIAKGMNKTNT